ncbi:hypothetical protein RJ641_017004, partial [Dillenia turbinata]
QQPPPYGSSCYAYYHPQQYPNYYQQHQDYANYYNQQQSQPQPKSSPIRPSGVSTPPPESSNPVVPSSDYAHIQYDFQYYPPYQQPQFQPQQQHHMGFGRSKRPLHRGHRKRGGKSCKQAHQHQVSHEPPQASLQPPLASGPDMPPFPTQAHTSSVPILPPCTARYELCRVDCNTFEILEQHKKGKKHKKKESLNKVMMGTISKQMPVPISITQPNVVQPNAEAVDLKQGSPVKLPVEDSKCDKASSDDTKGERDQQKNLPEKVKNPVAEMKEDQAGEQKTDHSGAVKNFLAQLVRHILPRATATAFESASETHQQQIPNRVMSEVSNVAPPQAIPPDLPVKDPPASQSLQS